MASPHFTRKQEGAKWTKLFLNFQLFLVLLLGWRVTKTSSISVGDNTVGYGKQGFGGGVGGRGPASFQRFPYKSLVINKQQRRFKSHGNEIIPSVADGLNDISEEPTCEELRAMWRYYKRQSRAEWNNEIPQYPFFGMFQSAAFMGKGRSRNRLRPPNPLYGRVMYKPNKQKGGNGGGGRIKTPKPFEKVRDMLGKGSSSSSAPVAPSGPKPTPSTPIVHHSPPPQSSVKESSFQKLKDVYREERIREKGPSKLVPSFGNREFGKVLLSPPGGHDGRRANKPRELMTAFEKIRFGHADDILDEGIRPNLDLMKRRTFSPTILLNKQAPQWKQQQQRQQQQHHHHHQQLLQKRRFLSNPTLLLTSSSSSTSPNSDRTTTSTSSRYFGKEANENSNNNIIASANDKQQLVSFWESTQDVPFLQPPSHQLQRQQQHDRAAPPANVDSSEFDEDDGDSSFAQSKLSNPPEQTVQLPSCEEVERDSCNQTSDCSCIGFALYRCYLNQCQILPLAFSVQDSIVPIPEDDDTLPPSDTLVPDVWHSEPIPSEKLGIWEESPPVITTTADEAERLMRHHKQQQQQRPVNNHKIEGSPSRLTDTTYLLLQDQNLPYP